MRQIILHAGPGKCGSTTVQAVLRPGQPGLAPVLAGKILPPRLLRALDRAVPAEADKAALEQIIETHVGTHPDKQVVFSHEVLFQSPEALALGARIALRHCERVKVIAYVRPQSDYLISSFGQWLFRKPRRLNEAAQVLRGFALDPELFWGVERQLIAAILQGWEVGRQLTGHLLFDWRTSVAERRARLPEGAVLEVGILPRGGFGAPLAQDFLSRIGLDPALAPNGRELGNASFAPGVIEATVNASEAGHATPKPHEDNRFFRTLSDPALEHDWPVPEFMAALKAYVETAFEAENKRFARENALPEAYFDPQARLTRAEIETVIRDEAARRARQPASQRAETKAARVRAYLAGWQAYQAGVGL